LQKPLWGANLRQNSLGLAGDSDGIHTDFDEKRVLRQVDATARAINSSRSSICAEHRKQVVPCYVVGADGTPLHECLLCEGNSVLHIGPHDVPRQVVVGSVAIRLELPERSLDIDQVSLGRGGFNLVFRRERSLAHLPMVEHPRQPSALIRERPVRDKSSTRR
jgi:hypothetical protein